MVIAVILALVNYHLKRLINMASVAVGSIFTSRTFEPRNEVKGQVARVYFYLHDRYNLSNVTSTTTAFYGMG